MGRTTKPSARTAPAAVDAPADTAPADQVDAPAAVDTAAADTAAADQVDAPADTAAADQVDAPADYVDAPAATAPAATAPDLVAIMALADGMVTADSTHQAALDAYRTADAKGRAAIRRSVDDASKQAIRDTMAGKLSPVDGMGLAGHWQRTLDALATAPTRTAATVDYADLIAHRIATFRHAADLLARGTVAGDAPAWLPENVPGDITITAEDLAERLAKIDAAWSTDDMADTRKQALSLAAAKIGRSGKQNDVGAAITAAFQGVAVGTEFTVSQIITRAAAAGIPADGTWNGRITARLIGGEKGCTVSGVAHARIGADRTHGGRKIA